MLFLPGDVLIVVELKREDGVLSPEQYFYLLAFRTVTPLVFLWKPSDWDEVVEILTKYRPKVNEVLLKYRGTNNQVKEE